MILAKDLRESVLQAAMQGQLTEHTDKDTQVEISLNGLLKAKERLINEGKVYKKKPTEVFYSCEDFPLEIPDNWKIVQLSDVSNIQEGAGILKNQYSTSGIQLFCVTNILDGSIDLDKKKLFVSKELYEQKFKHLTLNVGDIVTACSGGSWGKISFYNEPNTAMLNTSTLRLRFFDDLACNKYLYYVCKSQFFKNQLQAQLVGIQPNFGYAHYSRICIPFPPIEEQERIVAKVDELMAKIDEYEKIEKELSALESKISTSMKESILQAAITGGISERKENEKVNQSILINNKPTDELEFEIPDNWISIHLEDVTNSVSAKPYQIKDSEVLKNGKYNVVSQSKEKIIGYSDDESKLYKHNKPIVVFGDHTTIVKYIDFDFVVGADGLKIFEPKYEVILPKYLEAVLNYYCIGLEKVGGYSRHYKFIKDKPIPLPPIEEQQRIVDKLDKLLPLCDSLNDLVK